MSVLIKGMEMPKTCYKCKFALARFDSLPTQKYKRHDFECVLTEKTLTSTKRNRACPLVPVLTPHGRLIDADEVAAQLQEMSEAVEDVYPLDEKERQLGIEKGLRDARRFIVELAPTVIAAEEGEG